MSFTDPTPYERSYNAEHNIAVTGEDQTVYDNNYLQQYAVELPQKASKIPGNILNHRIFWEEAFYVLENYVDQPTLIKLFKMTAEHMEQYINSDSEEEEALKKKSSIFSIFNNNTIDEDMNKKTATIFVNSVVKRYNYLVEHNKTIQPKPKLWMIQDDEPIVESTKSKLMACPDCDHMVSKRAKTCPECGCPLKE